MKRQGEYVQNLSGDLSFKSFKPANLPPTPSIVIDDDMLKGLSEASRLLGKLDAKSSDIPNKELYISMYIRKEALLSSQIEGTQATLDDIFDPHIEENINLDVTDVINYIKASNYANELLEELPISNRFLKKVHEVLVAGIRGDDKNPGEFRRSQNWIGPQGSTLKNANFIPPNISDMIESMSSLEEFIHYNENTENLLKIALTHYQFETIHPFLDGNGRIGRLLINLMLKEYNILIHDTLYISCFFKRNRIEYYDRLMDVRLKGHYEQWIKFFLQGIIESAINSIECIDALVFLHKKHYNLIHSSIKGTKSTVISVFNILHTQPIIDIGDTAKKINKAYNTTASAVNRLVELGILKQYDSKARNRVFVYEDYLSILREGTEL